MSISSISSSLFSLSGTNNKLSSTSTSAATSPTQSLVDALNNVDASAASSSSYDPTQSSATLLGMGTSSASSSFTLTHAQQAKIKDILENYKDSPFTEATFDQIQNSLSSAGLGADQLMAHDQISSFSGTDSLISALNGNYSNSSASTLLANEQTKASNYLQGIMTEWKSLSGTSSTDSTSNSVAA